MLKLGFWQKLCNANPYRQLFHVFQARFRQVCAGDGRLSCLNSFQSCLKEVSLDSSWLTCSAGSDWRQVSRAAVLDKHVSDSAIEMRSRSSLQLFRRLNQDFSSGVHPYLDDRSNLRGTTSAFWYLVALEAGRLNPWLAPKWWKVSFVQIWAC